MTPLSKDPLQPAYSSGTSRFLVNMTSCQPEEPLVLSQISSLCRRFVSSKLEGQKLIIGV